MKRLLSTGILFLVAMVVSVQLVGMPSVKLALGEAEVLADFVSPVPEEAVTPEGIALDRKGNIYVGLRTTDGNSYIRNEIIKIPPRGPESVLTDLGSSNLGGVAGLITDPQGNVYAAFTSADDNHGVWKIRPNGTKEKLEGSGQILNPNALTFDKQGDLYVTDSDFESQGEVGVWKYDRKDRYFVPWCTDPLVLKNPLNPTPAPGANGIAFDPPNHIYVANTQRGLIVHVPVMNDGSAGIATSIANPSMFLIFPDGLSLDAHGNVYAAIPFVTLTVFPLPPLAAVVRIIPETGEVIPVLDPFGFPDHEYFDFPTSLAFGTGPLDKKSVFVVNMGGQFFAGFPPGSGPKLTQVGVGIPGSTGQ